MGKLIDRFKSGWRKQPNRADRPTQSDSLVCQGKSDASITAGGNGHHGKLVVVGRESEFPMDLVDYALDMAERLSYEIVALNTAPLSCETFKFFSSSRSKLCQDFQDMAEQSAAVFREEVVRRGLAFTHVVRFCDIDEALTNLQDEIGGIDFIVSDVQQAAVQELPIDGPRLQSEIVVYAMVK